MAELPEILIIARQMDENLSGRELTGLDFRLDSDAIKGLSHPAAEFHARLTGRRLNRVRGHGKWLILEFKGQGPNLLIHPGMGMDLLDLSVETAKEPHFIFHFSGPGGFSLRHWWFGKLTLAEPGRELEAAGDLGPAPLTPEFTPEALAAMLDARPRRSLKALLMDQKTISGIGNVYAQDSCFRIRAHPKTKLARLTPDQRAGLHAAIEDTLRAALKLGVASFEMDYWGKNGGWGSEGFLVGYRTGEPCPVCGTTIEKIKTGATHHYICPHCQPEPEQDKAAR